MQEKSLRMDLLIALCALVLSALAAGAATYQTYVINQQYSASVWPYLIFTTSSNSKTFIELDVENVGIGPALIRSAAVTRDGVVMLDAPDGSVTAMGRAIAPEQAAAVAEMKRVHDERRQDTSVTSLGRGDVVPAGHHLQLLRVDGPYFVRRLIADRARFDVSLCYCSLLGQCWTKRWQQSGEEPVAVRRCPDA
jgi:hypothetical protein